MLFEVEQVNVDWTIVSAYVHWMSGFTDVIKITEKVDRDVEALFQLWNVHWIDRVFDVEQTFLFKIL